MAEGYFTNQRLRFITDSTDELYPEAQLLNPSQVNLVPLQEKLQQLEHEASNQKRRILFTAEDSVKSKGAAENTLKDMNTLEEDVIRKINLVNLIVSEVQSLAENIEEGTNAKVDNAEIEAKKILEYIQVVSFQNFRDDTVDESEQANILLSLIQQYNFPVNNLSSAAMDLSNKIKNASVIMDDLLNLVQTAQEMVNTVNRFNKENRLVAQAVNFDMVKNFTKEAQDDLEDGKELNSNATQYLNDAKANIHILRGSYIDFNNNMKITRSAKISYLFFISETNVVGDAAAKLNNTILENDQKLYDLVDDVREAQSHAAKLHIHSVELDNLLNDTRNTDAVRAVSAYRDIETVIQAAREAAEDAMIAAENATLLVRSLVNEIIIYKSIFHYSFLFVYLYLP